MGTGGQRRCGIGVKGRRGVEGGAGRRRRRRRMLKRRFLCSDTMTLVLYTVY